MACPPRAVALRPAGRALPLRLVKPGRFAEIIAPAGSSTGRNSMILRAVPPACRSHRPDSGGFDNEIILVEVTAEDGTTSTHNRDQTVRGNTTIDGLPASSLRSMTSPSLRASPRSAG